jgi:hypothetical protein
MRRKRKVGHCGSLMWRHEKDLGKQRWLSWLESAKGGERSKGDPWVTVRRWGSCERRVSEFVLPWSRECHNSLDFAVYRKWWIKFAMFWFPNIENIKDLKTQLLCYIMHFRVKLHCISHSCDPRTTIYVLNCNLLATNYFLGINWRNISMT